MTPLGLGLGLGFNRGGGGITAGLPTNPLFLYDGLTNTNNGTVVSEIPDTLDTTNASKKFTATGDARFTLSDGLPTKSTTLSQIMIVGSPIVLDYQQHSIVFAGKIIGGSESYPIVLMHTQWVPSLTSIGNDSSSNAIGNWGSDVTNQPLTATAVGGIINISAPFSYVAVYSYDKTVSGNRSLLLHAIKGGVVYTTNSVVRSNNNIIPSIYSIGRASVNARTFSFCHLSGYSKLLTQAEQQNAVDFLIGKYSL